MLFDVAKKNLRLILQFFLSWFKFPNGIIVSVWVKMRGERHRLLLGELSVHAITETEAKSGWVPGIQSPGPAGNSNLPQHRFTHLNSGHSISLLVALAFTNYIRLAKRICSVFKLKWNKKLNCTSALCKSESEWVWS